MPTIVCSVIPVSRNALPESFRGYSADRRAVFGREHQYAVVGDG